MGGLLACCGGGGCLQEFTKCSIFHGRGVEGRDFLAGWSGPATLGGECAPPQGTDGAPQVVESEVQTGPEPSQQGDEDGDEADGQVPDSFEEPGDDEDVEELHVFFCCRLMLSAQAGSQWG